MWSSAKGLSRGAVLAVAATACMCSVSAAIAEPNAAHALAEKFARADEEAKRAEEARQAEERARAARRAAEQRAADEAEMLRAARAEADARKRAEEARVKAEQARAEAEAEQRAEEARQREFAARAQAEAEVERRQAEAYAREAARRQAETDRLHREAEEKRQAEAIRIAEEARQAEDERRQAEAAKLAEERRLEEEKRQAAAAKLAEEHRLAAKKRRAEAAKLADERRAAEKKQREEEARVAELKRQAEEAEKARKAEEARVADLRRQAEQAARARQAEEARLAEQQRIADEQAAQRRTQLEVDREREAQRIAEKFRLAREARERQQASRNSLGGPLPEPELPSSPFIATAPVQQPASPAKTTKAGPATAKAQPAPVVPTTYPQRVTVLLVVDPRPHGFGGKKMTANPVLCVDQSCYVSSGAATPASILRRAKALGPGNTLGRNAGPCRNRTACTYRGVSLASTMTSIQPVDMGFLRHDRRQVRSVVPDTTCKVTAGRLHCGAPIVADRYRAWIVPEAVAQQAGPRALQIALDEGLPTARPLTSQGWDTAVQRSPAR